MIDVIARLQRAGSVADHGVSELWRDTAALFRRRAEIDRLEERITTLEQQTVRLEEAEQENRRLRDLLAFRERLAGEGLAAAGIGRCATGPRGALRMRAGQ